MRLLLNKLFGIKYVLINQGLWVARVVQTENGNYADYDYYSVKLYADGSTSKLLTNWIPYIGKVTFTEEQQKERRNNLGD